MKKILSLTCLFCFALIGFAQELSDPAAKAVLEKVKTTYNGFKSMEADFTLSIEIPEEGEEIQKGKMYQQGEKYNLQLEGQSLISDGTTLWVYLKNNNEVQINDVPDEDEIGDEILSPKDLLRVYEKGNFYYALTNESVKSGKTVQEIEFKPKDAENSEYFKMRLMVEKKSSHIMSIKAFSKDGSRYTLAISDMIPNKSYDASTFVFDKSKYPNVYIEDLRE